MIYQKYQEISTGFRIHNNFPINYSDWMNLMYEHEKKLELQETVHYFQLENLLKDQ